MLRRRLHVDPEEARQKLEAHLPSEMRETPHSLDATVRGDHVHLYFLWAEDRDSAPRETTKLSIQLRPGRELWIARLEVHPELRGQGHGTALVDACEEFAEDLRCRQIRLFAMTRSYRFWKRLGYQNDPVTHRAMIKRL